MTGAFPDVDHVASLMRRTPMSASYKPALLKALVRACARTDGQRIALDDLGREFTRLYWNQTVIYHLRQATALSKESVAVKLVRATADKHRTRDLASLPAEARERLDRQMARLLPVNVLTAFHSKKPASMPPLFSWNPDDKFVTVSPAARQFLVRHATALELIANYHWADFLEGTNRLAPRILRKVSTDAARRGSLQKYLAILTEDAPQACFYCCTPFDAGRRPTVDHVIPWSFVFENALWNLVPACAPCNAAKSDSLPAANLLDKLVERNRRQGAHLRSRVNFLITGDEIQRLYQAAISVEWPGFWTPS